MSGPATRAPARRRALRALQVLGTLLLTALLLRQIDWGALGRLPQRIDWALMAAALAGLALVHGLNVLRWRLLVFGGAPPWHMMLAMYGAGLFSNNFLPSGIGGDGTRVLLLSRSVPSARALFAVLLDRLIGLVALGAPLLLALLAGLPPGLRPPALDGGRWGLVGLAAGLAGLAGLALLWRLPALRRPLLDRLERLREQQRRAGGSPAGYVRPLALGLLLSVAGHLLTALALCAVLAALGLPAPFGAGLWLVCSSALALLVPLAINGLGLVESTFVVLLGHYGVAATPALGVALVTRLMTTLFSLLGGLLSLRWSPPGDRPSPAGQGQRGPPPP